MWRRLLFPAGILVVVGALLWWMFILPEQDDVVEIHTGVVEPQRSFGLSALGSQGKLEAEVTAERGVEAERELVEKETGRATSAFNRGNNWENTLRDMLANIENGVSVSQHPPQVPMNVDQLIRDEAFNPDGMELNPIQRRELESAIKQLNRVYVDATIKGSLMRLQALVDLEKEGKYEFVNREQLKKLYADGILGNQTAKGGYHYSLLDTDGGWYLFRISDRMVPGILMEENKQIHADGELKQFIKSYFASLASARGR